MLTVYGHPMSTCTRKVLMTLAEDEIPFEMSLVDFATGAHKKEPHLGRQPFGRIPAIDDDGFQLFESERGLSPSLTLLLLLFLSCLPLRDESSPRLGREGFDRAHATTPIPVPKDG